MGCVSEAELVLWPLAPPESPAAAIALRHNLTPTEYQRCSLQQLPDLQRPPLLSQQARTTPEKTFLDITHLIINILTKGPRLTRQSELQAIEKKSVVVDELIFLNCTAQEGFTNLYWWSEMKWKDGKHYTFHNQNESRLFYPLTS